MRPFDQLTSTAVPMPMEHIDTDQIIPARFLKMVTRSGFGEHLFHDWRYNKDDTARPEFVLNNPLYSGEILVAGHNFGCGSSREHAAWAIGQYGFRALISSEFADIFKNNALNNGLLPIEVTTSVLDNIFSAITQNPTIKIAIDLENQKLEIPGANVRTSFDIHPFKKQCLMQGMDELDYLLSLDNAILAFEESQVIY